MGKVKRETGQGRNPEKYPHLEHWLSNQFLAVEIVVQIKLYKENQFIEEIKTELLWLNGSGSGEERWLW